MKTLLRYLFPGCQLILWTFLALTGTAFASGNADDASLRADAQKHLERAETVIEEAADLKALWLPAQEAADSARQAFERGDYELAISQARTAERFARMGIRQLDEPPYRHFE